MKKLLLLLGAIILYHNSTAQLLIIAPANIGDTLSIYYISNENTLTVNVSGGTAPYTYLWSPEPQDGQGTASATFATGINNVNIVVTDSNECTASTTIVGVDIKNNNITTIIKIYPNPTTDIVYIDVGNKEIADIQLFNNEGKLIQKSNKHEINLASCNPGNYIAKIALKSGEIISAKIIKQ